MELLTTIVILLVILVILSTTYDLLTRLNKIKSYTKILTSFSLITNSTTLFKMTENNENSIGAIHGIRSLSILSIIIVHSYFFRVTSPFLDAKNLKEFLGTKVSTIVSTSTISVDSFFVISGALITRSILRELDR